MFNTTNTYVGGGKQEVTITEHRAPTDDSTRIYDEMKCKAIESVLSSGFDELGIDFKWAVTKDHASQRIEFNYYIMIKDQRVDGKVAKVLANPPRCRLGGRPIR